MKKTAVDRFNESRQEESRRLSLKRKMEHDEKMASFRLKRHKYDLQYGSTPQTPDSPLFATAVVTAEDKQIEILRLQIRLAELTRDRDNSASAHSSSSQIPHASRRSRHGALSSQMPHASSSRTLTSHIPHHSEEVSTPSSGVSSLSYISSHNHNQHSASDSYVNTFMNSQSDHYREVCDHVPRADGEALSSSSVGADMASWPETYNFAA